MKRIEILKEIQKLPTSERITVLEKTLRMIKKEVSHPKDRDNLAKAAKALMLDYKNDKELTSFTNIDFEDFYEAR